MVSQEIMDIVSEHSAKLEEVIDYGRDFNMDTFGFKTLQRSYLLKALGVIIERPQDMFMRVALGIHGWSDDGAAAIETYNMLSNGFFIHATPTLFHAGTPFPQMSSCFLMGVEDSVEGIYQGLADAAVISKHAGGIGIHCHNIRSRGSYIRKTGGTSTGIVPFLKVYNDTARYIDQGGGKRKGSFAMYMEPHHPDIFDFLEAKRPQGSDDQRSRDLFYAMWVSDLFMERVKEDAMWSLFCPDTVRGLSDAVGEKYKQLYRESESAGLFTRQVKARQLWEAIITSQIETGGPYMLYKDAANLKSNQQHYGTIKSSNLCCEIMEYSDSEEYAVCNLASIALPKYVYTTDKGEIAYDYKRLREIVAILVRNLNKIIDKNFYPLEKAKISNMKHRPIGLGVQGLADTFALMKMPFESEEAKSLNRRIFKHIYYAAVEESCNLAEIHGSYDSFTGSPANLGKLQFDLWGVDPRFTDTDHIETNDLNWNKLKLRAAGGMRNSLLVAPMPTASTSQILGYNECIEPFTSNMYTRRTLAGEFVVMNKHLMKELINEGMWDDSLKTQIMLARGSIQGIPNIPDTLKSIYKTAWEIKQRVIIDLAVDRGAYVCQSQSLNVFIENPSYHIMNSVHFYGWKKGLKTGTYYIRTKPATTAQNFTIDPSKEKNVFAALAVENSTEQACETCSA